jgi:hypothetical protein
MNRRSWLKLGATTAASLGTLGNPVRALAMGKPKPQPGPGTAPNHFDTPTFQAFVETIIPGTRIDPTGAPGALEAETTAFLIAMEQSGIFPISLSFVQFALSAVLDLGAFFTHLRGFSQLSLEERTKLVAGLEWFPGMPFLLRLIRAPFYTATMNRVGWDYLGYPGPNSGYADFSFNEWDIAPPCPEAVGGNLP